VGVGKPVADAAKEAFWPTLTAVPCGFAEIEGAEFVTTVMVNVTGADVPPVLVAVTAKVNGDPVASVGVPLITPVVVFNVAQLFGNEPLETAKVGAGEPVAVMVAPEIGWPAATLNAVVELLITGGCVTVSVEEVEVAVPPTPLVTFTRNCALFSAMVVLLIVSWFVNAPLTVPPVMLPFARLPQEPPEFVLICH
jgi:hypothetical protein